MGGQNASNILDQRISELDLSDDFKKCSEEMGFQTLKDVADTAPGQLNKRQGFNYVWFGELVDFLNRQGLLDRLQPIQGNNDF